MKNPDLYLEMECGIKIPLIQVLDFEGLPLNVAPSNALKLLQNRYGKMEDEEAEAIDSQVFFYAESFERSEELLSEIKSATEIEVRF